MEVVNFHGSSLMQQCLICAAGSLTDYIDLTLVTAQTSHSETPVEDKLRTILTDKWREPQSDMAMVVCLACYQLIDQYDSLETRLLSVGKIIKEKYCSSFGRDKLPPCDKRDKQLKKKRGRPPKPSTKSPPKIKIKELPKPKRRHSKKKKVEKEEIESDSGDSAWVPDHDDRDSSPGPSRNVLENSGKKMKLSENGTKVRKELTKARAQVAAMALAQAQSSSDADGPDNPAEMQPQPAPPEPREEKNNNVYDEDVAMLGLNPGEKLRMGSMMEGEDGNITYACSYCDEVFVDVGMLKAHVRVRHRPEPLTTLLPVDMGFGTKVNCGMQLMEVTSNHDLGKPFICIFCDGAFKFKSNVLLHYKEKHTPYKPFSCVDCKEAFRRSMELSRHRVYYCPFRKRRVPKKRGREPKTVKKE